MVPLFADPEPVMEKTAETLVGKTLRFHFTDGPMKGKDFDHVFRQDGSVEWGAPGGDTTTNDKATLVKVGDGCFLASYLGAKGYTLTTALNAQTGKIVAVASDGKDWSTQHGTFKVVS